MKKIIYLVTTLLLIGLMFSACQEEKDPVSTPSDPVDGDPAKVASCEGCHANYEHLKAVHTPDPPVEDSGGCGGEAPHIEPYDRVYLGGEGYADFQNSIHGQLGCVSCHNGIDGTDNKDEAHSGEFLRHPSSEMREKCASCHPNIVNRAETSLHVQGWGQKNMVTIRSGLGKGEEAFDKLTDLMKKGYDKNCAKCHGSCGECHIIRPSAGGGGLQTGHKFNKTPHIRDNCTTCHVSRGGHAYFGVAIGTKPDVHLTKNGYKCIDCHSKDELHGEGQYLENRWMQKSKPMCEDCHTGLESSNTFHSLHMDDFNCQTCHSQDYNNCGSCHIPGSESGLAKISGGAGARIASHQKFKIGMNPIPEIKPYKMATLRQALSAPDSWDQWGTETLSNFDDAPTYKYTTPHNILRWTQRTEVTDGKPCFDACHISKDDDGNYRNKEYYLFESDLEDFEIGATKHLTVDGKLPSSWDVK